MTEPLEEQAREHQGEETSRGRFERSLRATAKRLLPEGIVKEVQRYRVFTSAERPIYLRKRVLNGIGFDRPVILPSPEKIGSVLFVCFGNIIRSPMAEALLIRELPRAPDIRIAVSSAGLNALSGRPAHPWAIAAASDFGISLEGHRARLLTNQMVDEADAIFAMDYQNQVQLLTRWAGAKEKVYMLSAYAGEDYRSVEIPDPYYMGQNETIMCYRSVRTCIHNLAHDLSKTTCR